MDLKCFEALLRWLAVECRVVNSLCRVTGNVKTDGQELLSVREHGGGLVFPQVVQTTLGPHSTREALDLGVVSGGWCRVMRTILRDPGVESSSWRLKTASLTR